MRLKAFSIFCLSFLVMFTLTSCDNENLVNEEELNFSDENPAITVLAEQKAGNDGYDEKGFSIVNCLNSLELHKLYSGLKLNFQLSGVTKIELESVDGYALSGTVGIQWDETGQPVIGEAENASSILVFNAPDENGFTPGKDYSIFTLPCDLYGGYRLSIYKDGLVAHYFGVHQTVELVTFISPGDLA